ncbi:MAG: nucleotidyl transferase AbiEii/AbiGii toxin family protein [Pseudomonadota bacterium]|nr:nucleotidyl transferase AbiEii/AbiGii toxin family protein [Pseudomonadota bacterium]
MSSTLLNIAEKIDPQTVAILETVSLVATELGMPYVVVGATARDLVLHYGHGARIERATRDVDFAIEVPDWKTFDALKRKLTEHGFRQTRASHCLMSVTGIEVDVVPFGHIEDHQAAISWPPRGEITMNVLGFQEACDSAEWVRIQDKPAIDIPVANPIGLVLLKLIAWIDRAADVRRKDARDIGYLLSSYEKIPEVTGTLYEDTGIMETYDWDLTLAASLSAWSACPEPCQVKNQKPDYQRC